MSYRRLSAPARGDLARRLRIAARQHTLTPVRERNSRIPVRLAAVELEELLALLEGRPPVNRVQYRRRKVAR